MKIYDVTVGISESVPIWEGDPAAVVRGERALAAGDGANVSSLCFGAHTGTHVDAPAHFINGANKIENLPLDALIGEALVVDVPPDVIEIGQEFVSAHVSPGIERVLFKTRNSAFWNEPEPQFHSDFTHLTTDAATWLAGHGAKLVGIDYLSIERFKSPGHPTHLALLEQGVVIVEGLNLTGVPAGKYELFCLPMRLRSHLGDGAPARAVLRTLD